MRFAPTGNILMLAAPAMFVLALMAAPAHATTVTVHPGDNLDPDTSAPLGVQGDSAPGFASGSFQANGSTKTANVFTAAQLFGSGSSVTIGDLQSLSYWTKQKVPASGAPVNWYLQIYTAADGPNNDASWYGHRLNLEPYFSQNRSEPDNTWVKWSTDGATNKLRVFDANRGDGQAIYGTYSDPFLSDLTGGTINWNDYYNGYVDQTFDYRSEKIAYVSLSTGSGWADGFTGQVDGLSINWNAGDASQTTNVNFEASNAQAVPEPSALAMFGLGLLGLGVLVRRGRGRRC